MDAVERLNRFKEESKIRERKHELYSGTEHVSIFEWTVAGTTVDRRECGKARSGKSCCLVGLRGNQPCLMHYALVTFFKLAPSLSANPCVYRGRGTVRPSADGVSRLGKD